MNRTCGREFPHTATLARFRHSCGNLYIYSQALPSFTSNVNLSYIAAIG
jgi:HD superfamily phosphohydrolase